MENLILNKNEIKVLNDSVINKISAGEVIERPLSIVKELVENSIDAQAKSITVEIKNGGINYIRVTDNGIGIEKNQVKTAFLNHATSKLKNFDDFQNLCTLGFRGEALCTIGAVSQVEMITKTKKESLGTYIKIHGGKFLEEKSIASQQGTTVIASNIFFNTPARLKFLKKSWIEGSYISNLMNKFALANFNIAFKFINNGKIVFNTRGDGNLKSVLACILGIDVAKNVFEINENSEKFLLEGYIATPKFFRNSRVQQNFFVNGRCIKNNILEAAVENAFKNKNKLMVGQFPVYVLNLCVAPSFIDVNVHPNKLEIKFENDDLVYDFVFNAIMKNIDAFEKKFWVCEQKFNIDSDCKKNILCEEKIDFEISKNDTNKNFDVKLNEYKKKIDLTEQKNMFYENKVLTDKNCFEQEKLIDENFKYDEKDKKEKKENDLKSNYKIIGCLFDTYWLIEFENKFFLLDQHAAHERILFEEIKNKFKKKDFDVQKLILPIEFELNDYDAKIFLDEIEEIKKFGFEIENHENKFKICGVPNGFGKYISREFFIDLLEELKSGLKKNFIYEEKIKEIMQMACKKAIKAGDKLFDFEIENLVRKIFVSEDLFNCPHGRPIIIEILRSEIEKLFMRRK